MLACLPPTLCITFPLMYPYRRGSHALSRKVGGCRRISVVSRPNQFAANYACQAISGQLSILRASPAHIAPLVRAPLRKRRGRGWRKIMAIIPPSWQSWFKISPFAKRKGARGMLVSA